jgi:dimethylaniline monooxygenase (N-oxide forming)
MSTFPTTAIIGAGSSGITVAKALYERGLPFECFEASDRVGGNWVFGNRNGMSAAYRDLHINTSRERMEYSDFPMPKAYPDFPHHSLIAAYFESYVERFGFRDRIRFDTAIERAAQRPDGTWELTDARGATRAYDMLIVANGHHWDARWPEPAFPGSDEFVGVQLHAHDYRDNEFLRDKDVVVLGMGNSAMDIAVESSQVARSTYLAARRGAWIIPKYLFGRPLDQFATNPHTPIRLASLVFELVLRVVTGPPERYGLPRPDHRISEAHPTVSGQILDTIVHGEVTPRPNIEHLGAEWVQFADGTRVHADVVIYCTGYRISFPFFDPGFVSAPDNRIELFRRVFAPGNPSLAFVGLLQPLGAVMPLAEAQGRWLADYLCGRYHLPLRRALEADICREAERVRRRYVASKRHTIQVDFDRYLYELRKERRRGAKRARAAGYALPVPGCAAGAGGGAGPGTGERAVPEATARQCSTMAGAKSYGGCAR